MTEKRIPRNFAIGALSAGGKTTVGAELLARLRHDFPPADGEPPWQVVDLGDIARARAAQMSLSIEVEAAGRPGDVDLAIEEACREAFRRGNSIVLGRLPWMVASEAEFSADTFRVWMEASPETRAGRRAAQKGQPLIKVLEDVRGRDADDATRYARLYPKAKFPPADPFKALDLVVSAERYRQPEIAAHIADCGCLWASTGPSSFAKVQF